jgi:hypothetical protein
MVFSESDSSSSVSRMRPTWASTACTCNGGDGGGRRRIRGQEGSIGIDCSITQAVIGLCDNYPFIQSCNHLTGMNTLIHKILTMLAYILLRRKGASDDRRLSS